ncbi:MAG: aldose 1-epimerase family protein [Frankia sp.]|nr:aldose 1-epimerase family protein [Frankia sp.]
MEPVAPSGRQLELVCGDSVATIVEVGGGLRDYRAGGVPVLHGYGPDELASAGKGQLLVPWPNRVDGGRYTFAGTAHQLPVTEVGLGNALHGLACWSSWELRRIGPAAATASVVVHAQPGYPFTVAFEAEYRLDDTGLTVTMIATNLGGAPAPVGMGAHPYLLVPGPGGAPVPVDDVWLTLPAATRFAVDERLIPTGEEPVAGGPFDFRQARPIDGMALDYCFGELARDDDGLARVRLAAQAGPAGPAVTVWMDQAWPYVQVFTSDTLDPADRRRGIAVEPVTCAPNAFNTGAGLRVLEPGESFGGSFGVQPAVAG